jgi:hypothetical protein
MASQSNEKAIEMLREAYVQDENGHVDTDLLGKKLQELCPWVTLDCLFRVIDRNKDGIITFEELLIWILGSDGAELDLTHVPVGEEPLIAMRLVVADIAKVQAKEQLNAPASFLVSMSRNAPLSDLATLISLSLGLESNKLSFMHSGQTFDFAKTVEGNGFILPGVAARRRGEIAELYMAFNGDTLNPMQTILIQHVQRENWFLEEAERKAVEDARREQERKEAEQRKKREAETKLERADVELAEQIEARIGVSAAKQAQLKGDPDEMEKWTSKGFVAVNDHHLIEETAEVAKRISSLMGGTGTTVIKVLRNVNETLMHRYQRAKQNLQEDAANIPQIQATSSKALQRQVTGAQSIGFLEAYDSSINELPLWHGTPSLAAAGGIAETGFDTNLVTTHVWGHGFYFADDVSVSQGYSRGGTSINSRYPFMKVMLLCRVLAGRVHVSQQPPSQSDQERLVADCLGPGGCFGAKSKFHCIQGGGYAYVAAHRDQVYPEFVILYQ